MSGLMGCQTFVDKRVRVDVEDKRVTARDVADGGELGPRGRPWREGACALRSDRRTRAVCA